MSKSSLPIHFYKSVENVLGKGYRTKDIMQSSKNLVTTSDMGSLISEEIKNLSRSF